MTPHESERIAAAFNQLRPDWPIRQLETLLRDPGLVHRPRRDVTVALAWVACEDRSYTPYRVLEAGPWWQAAAVNADTASDRLAWPDDAHRCRTCSMPRRDHERLWKDDHEWEPARQVVRDEETMHAIVQGLRTAKLDHVATPPPRERSTAGTEHVQPLREVLEQARPPFAIDMANEINDRTDAEHAEPDSEGVPSDPEETPTESETP